MNLPEFLGHNLHAGQRVRLETPSGNHKRKILEGTETTTLLPPPQPLTERRKRLITCWLAMNMPANGCDENLQNAVAIMQNQLENTATETRPPTKAVTRITITGERTSPGLVFDG